MLNIPLRTATGKTIRVGDIAYLDTVPEPPLITRQNHLLLTLLLVPVMYNWFAPTLSKSEKAASQRDGKTAQRPLVSGAPAS